MQGAESCLVSHPSRCPSYPSIRSHPHPHPTSSIHSVNIYQAALGRPHVTHQSSQVNKQGPGPRKTRSLWEISSSSRLIQRSARLRSSLFKIFIMSQPAVAHPSSRPALEPEPSVSQSVSPEFESSLLPVNQTRGKKFKKPVGGGALL